MKYKFLACVLSLAMLAGCSQTPSSQSRQTSSGSSSTVSETQSSSQVLQRNYETESLERLLSSINNAEAGSAGSTMKAAAVAADFVEFSVEYANADNEEFMLDDIQAWYDRLDRETKEMIGENWPWVYSSVKDLVRDPRGMAPLLADTGIETDFASMDLTNGLLLAERVQQIIGE